MPELIDKKETEVKVFALCGIFIDRSEHEFNLIRAIIHRCCEEIHKQPTIEPEVRRGRWIQYSRNADETYIECSNCCVASRPRHLQMVTRTGSGLPDYCPNCGAKMGEGG